jgi:calcium-independent phospholipase A2-gamma
VLQVSALSSVMNLPRIKNFIFRNYSYPMGVASQFPGSFNYRLWQAVRASSAAPGYYEEMKLDGYVHQVA